MALTLFGIPNCDTVRKARRWLDSHGVEYGFHDLRADGLDGDLVGAWIATLGWEQVINRRSTSWKALDAQRRTTMDAGEATRAALEAPTLIRRPVLVGDDILEFGFSEQRYAELLS
jgi:Spx/MgsR family transcriptional regulator